MGEQVEIAADDQRAAVDVVGGGLRSYSAGGRAVLDGYPAGERPTSGRGQVLIPWPNRLEDGAYEFEGRRYQLPLNELERRNAIHGLVREAVWRVREQAPHRTVVEYVLEPHPGYPFSLALAVEYALGESGLSVRTTAKNVGPDVCPFGSGQHPYLTVGTPTVDSAMLLAPGRTVLRVDDRGLPAGREPVEGTDYDFRRSRRIGATILDNAFTDLERDEDGLARIQFWDPVGETGLSLWVDGGYPFLTLFTGDPLSDVGRRSLAVEPMTCPPNAFRTGDSLIVLEPGESITSSWGIAMMGEGYSQWQANRMSSSWVSGSPASAP